MTDLTPMNEMMQDGRKGRRMEPTPDEVRLVERDELILSLVEKGISLRKAEHLVNKYPSSRIRRQLAWLPKRNPRRPASLLIASIERDFDAPAYND